MVTPKPLTHLLDNPGLLDVAVVLSGWRSREIWSQSLKKLANPNRHNGRHFIPDGKVSPLPSGFFHQILENFFPSAKLSLNPPVLVAVNVHDVLLPFRVAVSDWVMVNPLLDVVYSVKSQKNLPTVELFSFTPSTAV